MFQIGIKRQQFRSCLLQQATGMTLAMIVPQRISATFRIYVPIFGIILLAPAMAGAQVTPANTQQIFSLTPEQKAKLIAAGTEEKADLALDQARAGGDRQIHGSFGAMIGTGGARGVFGTAQIPLGENGEAAIAFENTRFGRPR